MESKCFISLLRETSKTCDKYISSQIKAKGLPLLNSHISLFLILSESGEGMLFNELSKVWKISKSSLSDIVSKYADLGLVKRCECVEDKRNIYISLTNEGIKLKSDLEALGQETVNLLMEGLTEQERLAFHKFVEKAACQGSKMLG